MESISNSQKLPQSNFDLHRQGNDNVSLDAPKFQVVTRALSEIRVYDTKNREVRLLRSDKVQTILFRDRYHCRGCGTNQSLCISQVQGRMIGIDNDVFPVILHVTLCEDCRKRFLEVKKLRAYERSHEDNAFIKMIRHKGVKAAIRHLKRLYDQESE